MPFLMGILAHLVVPPTADRFPIAFPEGSQWFYWAGLSLGLILMIGSLAVGALVSSKAPGPERRQPAIRLSWLVRLGMGEAVAILGLVVTIVERLPGAWLPFSLFSLIAMVAARPR